MKPQNIFNLPGSKDFLKILGGQVVLFPDIYITWHKKRQENAVECLVNEKTVVIFTTDR